MVNDESYEQIMLANAVEDFLTEENRHKTTPRPYMLFL